MRNIAIFIPVYNEANYIERTVSSILEQDYADFDLIISENHSTDETLSKLFALEKKDDRVKILRPAEKLNSYGNFTFVEDYVRSRSYFASMMLGGHDVLSHNVLSTSVKHLLENPGCAIAYQKNSYEIDEQDSVTRKWPVCHDSGHMNTTFDAILTLLSLMYNTPIFGLWRQDVRSKVRFRSPCVGGDHLYVAEAAAYGAITAIEGAQMYLRRAPQSANYLEKHFTLSSGDDASANDMYAQLSWLSEIIDQASAGFPSIAQELFRTSAVSLYLLRYNHHFGTFSSSLNAFAEKSAMSGIIKNQMRCGVAIKEILSARKKAA